MKGTGSDVGNSAQRGPPRAAGVVALNAQGRLPSDVAAQLMDVLADEPALVLCDLTGMAAAGPVAVEMFRPGISYLCEWPGTTLVVTAPDAALREQLSAAAQAAHVIVQAAPRLGLDQAPDLVHPLDQEVVRLSPQPSAPRQARELVAGALRRWELPGLVPAAALVASELVTNAVTHAVSVIDLRVSRVESLVKVAVRDRGGGRPSTGAVDASRQALSGRGLQLVQAVSRSWGVIPAQSRGKTVWAVLDDANVMATSS